LVGNIAERYGFAVIFPYGRGNAFGTPIAIRDIEESIRDLSERCDVDKDRLCCYGIGDGGLAALMFADSNSVSVSAVAVANAVLDRGDIHLNRGDLFSPSGAWLFEQSPLNRPAAFQMPLLLLHERENLHAPPMRAAESLLERCKALHLPTSLRVISRNECDEFQMFEHGCEFFSSTLALSSGGDRQVRSPKEDRSYSSSESAECLTRPQGTRRDKAVTRTAGDLAPTCRILDVLSQPFLLVDGTGKGAEIYRNGVVQSLETGWREQKFTEMQMKFDRDLTSTDVANYNLLLIGDFDSNKYLRTKSTDIPLTLTRNGITLCGKRFDGE
jgi:hypothetical protein